MSCYAYSDFPGDDSVNNLNLIVTAPDGQHLGARPATVGATTLDTDEQRRGRAGGAARQPAPGRSTVIGSNVPQGPQGFRRSWSVSGASLERRGFWSGGAPRRKIAPIAVRASPKCRTPVRKSYQPVWGAQGAPQLPVYKVTLVSVLRGILPLGLPYVFRQVTERAVDSRADLRWGPDRAGVPPPAASKRHLLDRHMGNRWKTRTTPATFAKAARP